MELAKEWYRSEFLNQELPFLHIPIEEELHDYIAIAKGDLDYVRQNKISLSFINQDGKGKLSDNELQNVRYHFVAYTALITRYCAMNGMELERAYSLSDFYIQEMDKCSSIPEILELHRKMCLDYCSKMHILKKSNMLSKPVVLCLNYIYDNLHSKITLRDLAEHVHLSENYLSKIFHREMGVSVSEYVTMQKIEKTKNLLSCSDYPIADIAHHFAFSSQSHFIQTFRKYVGVTPHKYRNEHFRSNWEDWSGEENT